jgi:hypothetical protein
VQSRKLASSTSIQKVEVEMHILHLALEFDEAVRIRVADFFKLFEECPLHRLEGEFVGD